MTEVTCADCGAIRPAELAATDVRPPPPCPECGGIKLCLDAMVQESLSITDNTSTRLTPGNQARNWRQRWSVLQWDLQKLRAPRTDVMSADAIHSSLQQLCTFFTQAYHLKDALKADPLVRSLQEPTIEDAVSGDAMLALLADLANIEKHLHLNKAPRSGSTPQFIETSGVGSSTGVGWQLSAKIAHGERVLDGLDVAEDAVAAWREKLLEWGLI